MPAKLLTRAERNLDIGYVALIACCLIFARNPSFFLSPRLWAEEGTVFLESALQEGGFASFFSQHLGYYSLFTKLSILGGISLFPLEYMAFVTTALSGLLQLCTSLAIYTSIGRLGEGKLLRLAFSLLPIILSTPEHWLNTINSQFWLATGTFFILNSRKINIFQIAYLLLAFMTGVTSLFFLPYFFIRLFKEKSPSLKAIASIGLISFIIQLTSLVSFIQTGAEGRFNPESTTNFIEGTVVTIMQFRKEVAITLFFPLIAIAIYYFARDLFKKGDFIGLLYTLGALFTYDVLAVFSSLGMSGGSRYGLPIYCGVAAIIINALSQKRSKTNILILVGKSFAVILLIIKLTEFFDTSAVYSAKWPTWKGQVQARDCKESAEIFIFPRIEGSNWEVTIPAHSGVGCRRI
ncbi:MAG: hypothetical protein VKI39_02585 [Synechococcus sp.]|nr:hypothetical protein [Synechococcus sp.]